MQKNTSKTHQRQQILSAAGEIVTSFNFSSYMAQLEKPRKPLPSIHWKEFKMFWYSLQKIPLHVFFLKGSSANNTDVGKIENSQEKSTLQLIYSAYEKCEYEHISSWYIKSTLCKRFLNCKKL